MFIEVGEQLLRSQNDYISMLTLWNEYKTMTGKIYINEYLCFILLSYSFN